MSKTNSQDIILPPRPLSIPEVAERYGVGRNSVYRWIRVGIIPRTLQVGQRRYIPVDALPEFHQQVA